MKVFIRANLLRSALAAATVLLCLGGGAAVHAQEAGGEAVEVRELRAALKVAQDQADSEKKRADEAEAKRLALVGSLAEAVRISEEQMTASRETELKLQALGVDLIARDSDTIEQRLLKAVRDLDISQQEVERQAGAIHRLSESFLKVLKASPSLPEAVRTEAEASLAAADAALAEPSEAASDSLDLSEARVVSIDSAIGLVVFDAGRQSGLRVGTPVTVLRGDRPLYSALIVDVRDSLSGAVLQDRMADAGDVEIGDGIRLLPEQNTL
jgi:hypothetical protein